MRKGNVVGRGLGMGTCMGWGVVGVWDGCGGEMRWGGEG